MNLERWNLLVTISMLLAVMCVGRADDRDRSCGIDDLYHCNDPSAADPYNDETVSCDPDTCLWELDALEADQKPEFCQFVAFDPEQVEDLPDNFEPCYWWDQLFGQGAVMDETDPPTMAPTMETVSLTSSPTLTIPEGEPSPQDPNSLAAGVPVAFESVWITLLLEPPAVRRRSLQIFDAEEFLQVTALHLFDEFRRLLGASYVQNMDLRTSVVETQVIAANSTLAVTQSLVGTIQMAAVVGTPAPATLSNMIGASLQDEAAARYVILLRQAEDAALARTYAVQISGAPSEGDENGDGSGDDSEWDILLLAIIAGGGAGILGLLIVILYFCYNHDDDDSQDAAAPYDKSSPVSLVKTISDSTSPHSAASQQQRMMQQQPSNDAASVYSYLDNGTLVEESVAPSFRYADDEETRSGMWSVGDGLHEWENKSVVSQIDKPSSPIQAVPQQAAAPVAVAASETLVYPRKTSNSPKKGFFSRSSPQKASPAATAAVAAEPSGRRKFPLAPWAGPKKSTLSHLAQSQPPPTSFPSYEARQLAASSAEAPQAAVAPLPPLADSPPSYVSRPPQYQDEPSETSSVYSITDSEGGFSAHAYQPADYYRPRVQPRQLEASLGHPVDAAETNIVANTNDDSNYDEEYIAGKEYMTDTLNDPASGIRLKTTAPAAAAATLSGAAAAQQDANATPEASTDAAVDAQDQGEDTGDAQDEGDAGDAQEEDDAGDAQEEEDAGDAQEDYDDDDNDDMNSAAFHQDQSDDDSSNLFVGPDVLGTKPIPTDVQRIQQSLSKDSSDDDSSLYLGPDLLGTKPIPLSMEHKVNDENAPQDPFRVGPLRRGSATLTEQEKQQLVLSPSNAESEDSFALPAHLRQQEPIVTSPSGDSQDAVSTTSSSTTNTMTHPSKYPVDSMASF